MDSSGYYLYRYTGRSWFKSKQSALRPILPNANIHHNEKHPGRGQRTDPRGPYWCLLLTFQYRSTQSFPGWAPRNSAHQSKLRWCHTWVYDVRVWTMAKCHNQGLKLIIHSDNRENLVVQWSLLASLLNLGSSWMVGEEIWVGKRFLGHHEQNHNWVIILMVSSQTTWCLYLHKYHSTLFTKNREGE